MADDIKNEALRLADALEGRCGPLLPILQAAAELRRSHQEHEEDQRVIAVWRGRTQRAEAQRDALLGALKRMASIMDKMGDMPDGFIHPSPWQTLKCEEALTQARAAIKMVEGEKE